MNISRLDPKFILAEQIDNLLLSLESGERRNVLNYFWRRGRFSGEKSIYLPYIMHLLSWRTLWPGSRLRCHKIPV